MKKLFTYSFAILYLLNIGLTTIAATDDATKKQVESLSQEVMNRLGSEPIQNCGNNLSSAYDLELFKFLIFLETNFENKSSNSSLANIAIGRYSEYKKSISDLLGRVVFGNGEASGLDQISAYAECVKLTDAYKQIGKEALVQHIKNNSSQKKTIILTEKYQAINSQLRDLNFEIAEMYGYLMAFKEKLPGFLKECIKQ
ncbi:MAG: hypothetical protein AAB373_00020 [Patescibacteria group bacterium]